MRVHGCQKCETFGLSAWIIKVPCVYGVLEGKSNEIGTQKGNILIATTFAVPEKHGQSQSRLERKGQFWYEGECDIKMSRKEDANLN